MRVLILDDEPAIPIALQDYLEDLGGYEISLANSGEEAIDKLKDFRADVCIVDMRLPQMTGNEFIIQAHELYPEASFIIHTGSLDYTVPPELREIGLSSRCIVHKPVSNMDLFHKKIQELKSDM